MSKTLMEVFSNETKNRSRPHIFGSDYYAKLARKPAGGQKLHPSEINGVSWPPPESSRTSTPSPVPELPKVAPPAKDITDTDSFFSSELPLSKESIETDLNSPPQLPKVRPPSRESIETDLIIPSHLPKIRSSPKRFIKTILDTPPEPPKTVPPPREFIETNGIHQALKAIVTPVDETMPYNSFESQFITASQETTSAAYQVENYTVQTNTTEVTSDSDTSFINFYDVEHSQVVKKSKHEDVHIPIKATPVGVSYRTLADQNETNFKSVISHDHDEINVSFKEVPVAKPRVLSIQTKKEHAGVYDKAPVVAKQRNIYLTEKPILRRNLSESSLLEASFDAPPKVLNQKKDNTLISKIYKDPKVRLFALHSREEIPGTDSQYVKPVFQTQRSFDFKVSENASLYLSKGKSYNSSEDGITSEYESGRTGKMSFFSSEEDLLSLNSELSFRPNDAVMAKNEEVKLNGTTYKDDPSKNSIRTPSPNALLTPKTPSTRKFIYSSQEDLLSIDEVGSIPQRKDNTLISKIYQNANVRNFALKTHRDFVSGYEPTTLTSLQPQKVSISDDEHYLTNTKFIQKQALVNKKIYSSYDDLSSADISLETHQIHHPNGKVDISLYTDQLGGVEDGYISEDLDIGEIAKRHVVREALGKFSKSEVNIKSAFHRSMSGEDDDGTRVSVRDLRKKFENNNVSSKPVMSSLTARSISKQVKESLKQQ